MTAPEPLARVTASPFTKALLEAAREDRSPAGAAERALDAALGAAAAGSASGGAASTAQTALGGKLAAGKALLTATQFAVLGLLGGAALIGTVSYVLGPKPAESAAPTARAPLSMPVQAVPSTTVALIPSANAPASSLQGAAPLAVPHAIEPSPSKSAEALDRVALPSAAAFPAASPASTQDVDAQLSELRVARSLLGAPNAALRALDDFNRAHPTTPLAEEASVLRIEALVNAGRQSEASALGTAFFSKYPHSAYARRVRSKLEQQ